MTTQNKMKLYAFCYPNQVRRALFMSEPFEVKIGQTVNEAQDRIDGQTSGSGTPEDPITLWTTTLNGEVKTDHQFHRFLVSINSGVSRVKRDKKKTTEWFEFECRDHLRLLAVKFTEGEIDKDQFKDELSGYVTKVLNKALEHQERQLAPVKTPEPSVVYQEVIKVMTPWSAELNNLRSWYDDEVMVQDMKYIDMNKRNQPYLMSFDLISVMFSRVMAAPSVGASFLVVEAIEIVDVLIKLGYDSNRIQFMSTSSMKRDMVEVKYGVWVRNGDLAIDSYKTKKGDFRYVNKFDYCLMNPPYDRNLHEDFFNMANEMANHVISVAPATWLLNRKPVDREQSTIDLIDYFIKNGGEIIKFVDGVTHFKGARIDAPIAVVYMNPEGSRDTRILVEGKELDFNRITVAGQVANRFFDLISDDSLESHANKNSASAKGKSITNSVGKFYINQCWKASAGGSIDNAGFYAIFKKTIGVDTERADNTGWVSWAFDTEQEAQNFINYGKTKFARFMLSLYKINGHIDSGELAAVPWMDFTQEWTDEKLCKQFGITKAEWAKIDQFIPDYY